MAAPTRPPWNSSVRMSITVATNCSRVGIRFSGTSPRSRISTASSAISGLRNRKPPSIRTESMLDPLAGPTVWFESIISRAISMSALSLPNKPPKRISSSCRSGVIWPVSRPSSAKRNRARGRCAPSMRIACSNANIANWGLGLRSGPTAGNPRRATLAISISSSGLDPDDRTRNTCSASAKLPVNAS